jgi:hypothetical protein
MRYKKSVEPNQIKTEYTPNSYITINLPKGILDLHSFTLYYKANTANYRHTSHVDKTSSFTFQADATGINDTNNTITIANHGFSTGQEVVYTNAGVGTNIQNLATTYTYYVIKVDVNTIALATTATNAAADTRIDIAPRASAETHTLTKVVRTYRTIRRFLPRLSSCVISDLIVKIDNQIIQNTQEYNMLAAILNDIVKEYDDVDSTVADSVQEHSFKSNGFIGNISRLQAIVRPQTFLDKYISGNKRTYFIDKWLGFLNEGNRFFDARDKNIEISIKLAPPNILYRGIYTAEETTGTGITFTTDAEFDPDYVLSEIKATVDVLDDVDAPYLGLSSAFVYNDYKYTLGPMLSSSKKYMTYVEADKPVNWVLGTFSHPERMTDTELQLMHCSSKIDKFGAMVKDTLTLANINAKVPNSLLYSYEVSKFQKDCYLLNSSAYFIRSGDGILYTKYRMNNYEITPPLDVVACFNETKKTFQSQYKKVSHIYSFESEFFANAVLVDDNTETFKRLEWEIEIDTNKYNNIGGYPMLFCCIRNKLP